MPASGCAGCAYTIGVKTFKDRILLPALTVDDKGNINTKAILKLCSILRTYCGHKINFLEDIFTSIILALLFHLKPHPTPWGDVREAPPENVIRGLAALSTLTHLVGNCSFDKETCKPSLKKIYEERANLATWLTLALRLPRSAYARPELHDTGFTSTLIFIYLFHQMMINTNTMSPEYSKKLRDDDAIVDVLVLIWGLKNRHGDFRRAKNDDVSHLDRPGKEYALTSPRVPGSAPPGSLRISIRPKRRTDILPCPILSVILWTVNDKVLLARFMDRWMAYSCGLNLDPYVLLIKTISSRLSQVDLSTALADGVELNAISHTLSQYLFTLVSIVSRLTGRPWVRCDRQRTPSELEAQRAFYAPLREAFEKSYGNWVYDYDFTRVMHDLSQKVYLLESKMNLTLFYPENDIKNEFENPVSIKLLSTMERMLWPAFHWHTEYLSDLQDALRAGAMQVAANCGVIQSAMKKGLIPCKCVNPYKDSFVYAVLKLSPLYPSILRSAAKAFNRLAGEGKDGLNFNFRFDKREHESEDPVDYVKQYGIRLQRLQRRYEIYQENRKEYKCDTSKAPTLGPKKIAYGDTTTEKSRLCSGCKSVVYCDIECQRNDWVARHKLECSQMKSQYDRLQIHGVLYKPNHRAWHMEYIREIYLDQLGSRLHMNSTPNTIIRVRPGELSEGHLESFCVDDYPEDQLKSFSTELDKRLKGDFLEWAKDLRAPVFVDGSSYMVRLVEGFFPLGDEKWSILTVKVFVRDDWNGNVGIMVGNSISRIVEFPMEEAESCCEREIKGSKECKACT